MHLTNRKKFRVLTKCTCAFVALAFSLNLVLPSPAYAQAVLNLPVPGTMVGLSPAFNPPVLRGITIHPDNPLKFDFLVDMGDEDLRDEALRRETAMLVRYFLAALTLPEDDLWVNLSPHEQDRIAPEKLSVTELGRDLLAQDYILKQLTASLIYPDSDLGKKFWDRIRAKAKEKFGTTDVPVNTFNKVWVVPETAVIYEHNGTAFNVDSYLKVMLEEDYLALSSELAADSKDKSGREPGAMSQEQRAILRELIIPEIEKEVNTGKNFAQLRQIYNSVVLAAWFKQALKESLLGQVYADKAKVSGVDVAEEGIREEIYQQYLEAYKKGAYNYIKEEYDPAAEETVPRKYFSGGNVMNVIARNALDVRRDFAMLTPPLQGKLRTALANRDRTVAAEVQLGEIGETPVASDRAMMPQSVLSHLVNGGKPAELTLEELESTQNYLKTDQDVLKNARHQAMLPIVEAAIRDGQYKPADRAMTDQIEMAFLVPHFFGFSGSSRRSAYDRDIVEHIDSAGNRLGASRLSAFDRTRIVHVDPAGNEIGYSRPFSRQTGYDRDYMEHFDMSGNMIGFSRHRSVADDRIQHYDFRGNEIGSSRPRETQVGPDRSRFEHQSDRAMLGIPRQQIKLAVFEAILGVMPSLGAVDEGSTLRELGADSLDIVEIVMNVETSLSIGIPDEFNQSWEVGQLIDFIAQKGRPDRAMTAPVQKAMDILFDAKVGNFWRDPDGSQTREIKSTSFQSTAETVHSNGLVAIGTGPYQVEIEGHNYGLPSRGEGVWFDTEKKGPRVFIVDSVSGQIVKTIEMGSAQDTRAVDQVVFSPDGLSVDIQKGSEGKKVSLVEEEDVQKAVQRAVGSIFGAQAGQRRDYSGAEYSVVGETNFRVRASAVSGRFAAVGTGFYEYAVSGLTRPKFETEPFTDSVEVSPRVFVYDRVLGKMLGQRNLGVDPVKGLSFSEDGWTVTAQDESGKSFKINIREILEKTADRAMKTEVRTEWQEAKDILRNLDEGEIRWLAEQAGMDSRASLTFWNRIKRVSENQPDVFDQANDLWHLMRLTGGDLIGPELPDYHNVQSWLAGRARGDRAMTAVIDDGLQDARERLAEADSAVDFDIAGPADLAQIAEASARLAQTPARQREVETEQPADPATAGQDRAMQAMSKEDVDTINNGSRDIVAGRRGQVPNVEFLATIDKLGKTAEIRNRATRAKVIRSLKNLLDAPEGKGGTTLEILLAAQGALYRLNVVAKSGEYDIDQLTQSLVHNLEKSDPRTSQKDVKSVIKLGLTKSAKAAHVMELILLSNKGSEARIQTVRAALENITKIRLYVKILGSDRIQNESVRDWVNQAAHIVGAGEVEVVDISDDDRLLQESMDEAESVIRERKDPARHGLIKLPDGTYYTRSHPEDVARSEKRTFVATASEDDKGAYNNWTNTDDVGPAVMEKMSGAVEGKKLYVIPYIMGPADSPFRKLGVQLTTSRTTVLNMIRMARVGELTIGKDAWAALETSNDYLKAVHIPGDLEAQAQMRKETGVDERYFVHMPELNMMLSYGSDYGGNALSGKKFYSLRQGMWTARNEGWLAEHMLILEIQYKKTGEKKYIAAAFPSASGKTNLAMMEVPEALRDDYEVRVVGDDIAWLRPGEDGRLYAVNPEFGYFGVVPGTNEQTNPNFYKAMSAPGTILINVAFNPATKETWWEGKTKEFPSLEGDGRYWQDWRGNRIIDRPEDKRFSKDKADAWAHPNSRATALSRNAPNISEDFESAQGVPISAIFWGGRVKTLEPLIRQLPSAERGVYDGATMMVQTTAASDEGGAKIVSRPDPMAQRPFFSYPEGQYFEHWLDVMKGLGKKAPAFFHVNWFRENKKGQFMWPGFGENLRVLLWALDRAEGKGKYKRTPIGNVPTKPALDLRGLDEAGVANLTALLRVDREAWQQELKRQEEYFRTELEGKVPDKFWDIHAELTAALADSAMLSDEDLLEEVRYEAQGLSPEDLARALALLKEEVDRREQGQGFRFVNTFDEADELIDIVESEIESRRGDAAMLSESVDAVIRDIEALQRGDFTPAMRANELEGFKRGVASTLREILSASPLTDAQRRSYEETLDGLAGDLDDQRSDAIGKVRRGLDDIKDQLSADRAMTSQIVLVNGKQYPGQDVLEGIARILSTIESGRKGFMPSTYSFLNGTRMLVLARSFDLPQMSPRAQIDMDLIEDVVKELQQNSHTVEFTRNDRNDFGSGGRIWGVRYTGLLNFNTDRRLALLAADIEALLKKKMESLHESDRAMISVSDINRLISDIEGLPVAIGRDGAIVTRLIDFRYKVREGLVDDRDIDRTAADLNEFRDLIPAQNYTTPYERLRNTLDEVIQALAQTAQNLRGVDLTRRGGDRAMTSHRGEVERLKHQLEDLQPRLGRLEDEIARSTDEGVEARLRSHRGALETRVETLEHELRVAEQRVGLVDSGTDAAEILQRERTLLEDELAALVTILETRQELSTTEEGEFAARQEAVETRILAIDEQLGDIGEEAEDPDAAMMSSAEAFANVYFGQGEEAAVKYVESLVTPGTPQPFAQVEALRQALVHSKKLRNDLDPKFPDRALEIADFQAMRRIVKDTRNRLRRSDRAMTGAVDPVGGIDITNVNAALQIKRDENGVALPLNLQPLEAINANFQGLVPLTIQFKPVVNLPMLLGVAKPEAEGQLSSL